MNVSGVICNSPIITESIEGLKKVSLIIFNETSGYIPCVASGSEAIKAQSMSIGDEVHIYGTYAKRKSFDELIVERMLK